ncbi:MAG: dockerin [Verrucomicrobiota bacterium]
MTTACFLSRLLLCLAPCLLLACFAQPAGARAGDDLRLSWDWSGVIGTGQSLAVGEGGKPVLSTIQPYNNLKLSTGNLPWPIDPTDPALALVPLTEPDGRYSTNYPSSWPMNLAGETPHSAMANQITAMARAAGRDYTGVHSEVGENGQCMIYLRKNPEKKGVNGRSYEAALTETRAITRLARAAGKSYGVGAIIVTHGECDAGNVHYAQDLHQLWSDYNSDLPAITGQTQALQMIVSQQNSINDRCPSTLAQWKVGVDHPESIVCSGPKYQYPYSDGVHLNAQGYRMLGEKYGQIYFERVVRGRNWQPLQPVSASRKGAVVTVRFHVPTPPLAWDAQMDPPHAATPEWKSGRGFEIVRADGSKAAIQSAAISGDTVVLTCESDPGRGARVSYALYGEKEKMKAPHPGTARWGLLRDSDPFRGAVTGAAQPNYSVAFELPLD